MIDIKQNSQYLHIMPRGINKQIIFEQDSDYKNYLQLLRIYSKKYNIKVIAYCLMDNHVHILIFDEENKYSVFLNCVNHCYAKYFNKKYNRVGSLFQKPTNTKFIYNQKYLITVFFYILCNPERANISLAQHYKWNSYNEYFKDGTFISKKYAENIYGDIKNLDEILHTFSNGEVICENNPIKNQIIKEKLNKEFGILSTTNVSSLNKYKRNIIISMMKSEGLTIKEISRLTGISKGIIQYL